jgi:peptide/nickel transport system ATP-binding protein
MAPPRHGPDGHLARCHFDPPFAAPADEPGMAQRVAVAATPILRVSSLGKTYRALDFTVRAVHDISFALGAGETLGLVGESGSGKTTLARMLLGLVAPDPGGAITLDGRALAPLLHQRTHADRKALQIIFQNPDSALNRAQRVRSILTRPLTRLARLTGAARARRLAELIEGVRLGAAQLAQLPRALSGGLKQRVAIARAFAGDPRLVVCDEPTSALDVSVQAAILNLLVDLQRRNAVAYIFISHDLNVVRYVSDRIAVLYRGNLVEIGPAEAVFAGPHHPYTAMLLSAGKGEARLPDSADLPVGGCVFQARCPRHLGAVCQTVEPALGEGTHLVRCHIGREYL